VKAPATSSQKKGTPAASGARRSAAVSRTAAAPKGGKAVAAPAKKAVKTGAQAAVKVLPKTAASARTSASAQGASSPAALDRQKVPAPLKSAPSTPPVRAAVAAAPRVQPVKKTVVKPTVKTSVKSAGNPASTLVAAPAGAAKPSPTSATKPAKASSPVPAPIHVEPTVRPLGKRAAKKVMMEQMTQAAVVPTHAPDAAKATFSHMTERAVMTPPVPSSIQKDPKRANNWKTMTVEQLTDQDVQAMPDSEYMSDLQLAFFRRKLSQLRADMLANAGETTEHLREDTVVVPDPADRATIEEEHALELRTRDRERKLLKKIEQAINRIDSGEYGYCDETGEAIGVGRLMARPTASLSLEAQQRRELKQKMFGD